MDENKNQVSALIRSINKIVLPDESQLIEIDIAFVQEEAILGTKKVGLSVTSTEDDVKAEVKAQLDEFIRHQETVLREQEKSATNEQVNGLITSLEGVIVQ